MTEEDKTELNNEGYLVKVEHKEDSYQKEAFVYVPNRDSPNSILCVGFISQMKRDTQHISYLSQYGYKRILWQLKSSNEV